MSIHNLKLLNTPILIPIKFFTRFGEGENFQWKISVPRPAGRVLGGTWKVRFTLDLTGANAPGFEGYPVQFEMKTHWTEDGFPVHTRFRGGTSLDFFVDTGYNLSDDAPFDLPPQFDLDRHFWNEYDQCAIPDLYFKLGYTAYYVRAGSIIITDISVDLDVDDAEWHLCSSIVELGAAFIGVADMDFDIPIDPTTGPKEPNNSSHMTTGYYWRSEVRNDAIWVTLFRKPGFFWDSQAQATVPVGGKHSQPSRVEMGNDGICRLLYTNTNTTTGATDVYRAYSHDDGVHWRDFILAIPGGAHPAHATNLQSGDRLEVAMIAGTPNTLHGAFQGRGDLAPGTVFTLKDTAGTDLHVQDDSLSVTPEYGPKGRWLLTCMIEGESAPSDWGSADDGLHWKKLL